MKYFINDLLSPFVIHSFVTSKYDCCYIPNIKRVGIMKKHILWSNRILRNYKNLKCLMKLDADLFFKVLPDIEEIKNYHKWMSDKIINQKIERLLKLRIFL